MVAFISLSELTPQNCACNTILEKNVVDLTQTKNVRFAGDFLQEMCYIGKISLWKKCPGKKEHYLATE